MVVTSGDPEGYHKVFTFPVGNIVALLKGLTSRTLLRTARLSNHYANGKRYQETLSLHPTALTTFLILSNFGAPTSTGLP